MTTIALTILTRVSIRRANCGAFAATNIPMTPGITTTSMVCEALSNSSGNSTEAPVKRPIAQLLKW